MVSLLISVLWVVICWFFHWPILVGLEGAAVSMILLGSEIKPFTWLGVDDTTAPFYNIACFFTATASIYVLRQLLRFSGGFFTDVIYSVGLVIFNGVVKLALPYMLFERDPPRSHAKRALFFFFLHLVLLFVYFYTVTTQVPVVDNLNQKVENISQVQEVENNQIDSIRNGQFGLSLKIDLMQMEIKEEQREMKEEQREIKNDVKALKKMMENMLMKMGISQIEKHEIDEIPEGGRENYEQDYEAFKERMAKFRRRA